MAASVRPVVLFGYLGGRNLGDDAMLRGFFDAAKPAGRRYVVLAREPAAVEIPDGIDAEVRPAKLGSAWRAILGSGGLVRIGGTSFHDEYDDAFARSMLVKYLKLTALFLLPALLGKPVAAIGVGFGVVRHRSTRFLASLAMRVCSTIIVRDPESLAFASGMASKARLGVDLAFLSERPDVVATPGTLGISLLDLAPYGYKGNDQDRFWCDTALAALNQVGSNGKILLFIFKDNDAESDRPVAKRLRDALTQRGYEVSIVGNSGGLDQVRRRIAECEVFLATRYHAAVIAGQSGARLLIVPYNAKLNHYAADMQIPPRSIVAMSDASVGEPVATQPRPSADFATRMELTRNSVLSFLGGIR